MLKHTLNYYNECFTNTFKIRTPMSPTTDTMDSITDHERMVSFMLRLKYSLNIQNPESFTCEKAKLPAPMASTIRLGSAWVWIISGATIPAAVRPAIVAEPRLMRI